MKRFALILALVLLLCGCTETPPPATTAPPLPTESSAPMETTIPDESTAPVETTVPTVITDFAPYEDLLSFDAEPNWLGRSLGCLYESPSQINLNYMFYLGVDYPGSWGEISDESRRKLVDYGFWDEMDIQILPAEILEQALRECFGVGLDDVTIPQEWCYIEAEDAFCSNHNDAFFPGIPIVTAVEDDGVNIWIHYTIEGYWIPDTEEFLDSASLILGLERQEDGQIHALFNVLAP